MHAEVKQYADEGNIKGLKYIFVDALDVDPTFEKYSEDFNYCKNKNLFEANRELSPKKQNSSDWNMEYWKDLKRDLLENFSEERLKHMMAVAKVIYADKIAHKKETPPIPAKLQTESIVHETPTPTKVGVASKVSDSKKQEQEIEAEKKRIAEKNRRVEAERQQQQRENQAIKDSLRRPSPKKAGGTLPIAAIAGVAIAALILLMFIRK